MDLFKKKEKTTEKSVSLSVEVPEDGSAIKVDVKRKASVGKRRSQRRFYAFIIIVLIALSIPIVRTGFKLIKLKVELINITEKRDQLLLEQESLNKEKESLEKPATIEKIAREQLGLVNEGETVIIPSIPNSDVVSHEEIRPGEQLH